MNKKGFWEIKIRKVNNGYTCSWEDESDSEDGYFIKYQQVFQYDDSEFSELICIKNVLDFVAEHFGTSYSKHNKKNLNIEVK